jgi:hypothetical protein
VRVLNRLSRVPGAIVRPLLLAALLHHLASAALAQSVTACVPSPGDARALLARGVESAGIGQLGRPALGLKLTEMVSQDYQSDRPYPPFLQEGHSGRLWYYPDRRLEFSSGEAVDPFGGRPLPAVWSTVRGSWFQRDTVLRPVPPWHRFSSVSRPLNAWAVLADWSDGPAPQVTGRCMVRDFPRMRLSRAGPIGEERLYLDPASGLPVQYERVEEDATGLWGRQAVVYVYSNWVLVGPAQYPMASFRLVDGSIQISRTAAPVPPDSVPPSAPALADTVDMRVGSSAPADPLDTVRVSAHTFLLRTRAYTNVVTLARDTVFLLDAQWNGEARARQDSSWIARLFPGKHLVVLVVSDLAWPHIAGVRAWVAMGARVVAHRSSGAFLANVVNRRWSDAPDLLERRRARSRFRFIPVTDSLSLAGGEVRVYAINGIGSEGSLMTWLPEDRFLFPGDYVQGLTGPSMAYAGEVVAAVRRTGLAPARFAAMHMGLTEWSRLLEALEPAPRAGAVAGPLEIDPARLAPARDSLVILLQGKPAGFQVALLERSATGFRFSERTVIGGMMSQETEVQMDGTGQVRTVRHEGRMPRGTTRIALDYAAGRVQGTVQPADARAPVTVDTTLPPGTIDDNALHPLFRAIRWRDGASWTIPVYLSGQRKVETRVLTVRGVEPVTVNGTAIPAFRAELALEGRTVTIYVSRAAPHRVLRIVPTGAPIEFVASE